MFEHLITPWSLRIFNAIGSLWRLLGWPLLQLRPEQLERRAISKSGLRDFGDPDYREGLALLCRSLRGEAKLTLAGRIAMRDQVVQALVTRLRLVQRRKQAPEIFAAPLPPLLIVVGLPRSGTTFLHRLLALDPNGRTVPMWELRDPFPPGPEKPDRRRSQAQKLVQRLLRLQPDIHRKHHFDADQPEECALLFDGSLWSLTFWRLAPVYQHLAWFLRRDPQPGYRWYRAMLQLLHAAQPKGHMVLKNPDHTGFIDTLLEILPEARLVQTHRAPQPVIASYNSLMDSVHSCVRSTTDKAASAQASVALWGHAVDANHSARERIAAERLFDLHYDDLVANPAAAVQAIYTHFGLPFSPAFASILDQHLRRAGQRSRAPHHYDLTTFGIDAARVEERFAHYTRCYLAPTASDSATADGQPTAP